MPWLYCLTVACVVPFVVVLVNAGVGTTEPSPPPSVCALPHHVPQLVPCLPSTRKARHRFDTPPGHRWRGVSSHASPPCTPCGRQVHKYDVGRCCGDDVHDLPTLHPSHTCVA